MIRGGRIVFFTVEKGETIAWVFEKELRVSCFLGKFRAPAHIQDYVEALPTQDMDVDVNKEETAKEAVEAIMQYLYTAAEEITAAGGGRLRTAVCACSAADARPSDPAERYLGGDLARRGGPERR